MMVVIGGDDGDNHGASDEHMLSYIHDRWRMRWTEDKGAINNKKTIQEHKDDRNN